jgi:hypothetical protein
MTDFSSGLRLRTISSNFFLKIKKKKKSNKIKNKRVHAKKIKVFHAKIKTNLSK